jgi:antitoxin (DNA-binding transcriptional repressor) of toxin-antitoxin stability system
MTTIAAPELKAKCSQILDQVYKTGERFQVTRHGKVIAELGPTTSEGPSPVTAGFGKGKIRILGDIMEPIDVEWDALK